MELMFPASGVLRLIIVWLLGFGVVAALVGAGASHALAAPASRHGVPLPPGSRSADQGAYVSGRGFRATVDFYKRFLKQRGLAHEEVPVYGYRGVVVARFLSRRPGTEWTAIHVYRHEGRTWIYVVP